VSQLGVELQLGYELETSEAGRFGVGGIPSEPASGAPSAT
jgi:hypothetical protein